MTTFGISAECGRLIEYDTVDELRSLCADGILRDALPLGGGSNMLFTRPQCDITVIHCRNADYSISPDNTEDAALLTAAAGCVLDNLCRITSEQGFWGLENLSGIPGEIGGAAVQNVGAYGTEFSDVVKSVRCLDTRSNTIVSFTADECRYGYRDSRFKHLPSPADLIVVEAELMLSTMPKPNLRYAALAEAFGHLKPEELTPSMLREEVLRLRNGKLPDPSSTGSAGSFFKNPVVSAEFHREMQQRLGIEIPGHPASDSEIKLSAAWLIDKAGCKSFTCGGASLWPSQPLVIVNTCGKATGTDVIGLENKIISRVHDVFGVMLTPEVIHI